MKKLLISLLFFFLISGFVRAAEWNAYSNLYATYIDFQNSKVKDNGWALTGYLAFKDNYHHSLEFGLSQTHVNYKNEETLTQIKKKRVVLLQQSVSDIDQTDFNFVYTNINQILSNHIFKIGFHYINSDDELTDQGKIFYFQGSHYVPYLWNAGLEFAYSRYDNSPLKINVFQVRPHIGFYFNILEKRIYGETRFYYIHADKVIGSSIKNCYSLEQMVSSYIGRLDFMLSGWLGQQIFAVKNESFVVYNLADKYLGGLEFELGYKITDNLRTSFDINQQWLEHVEYNDKASQSIFTISIGGSF